MPDPQDAQIPVPYEGADGAETTISRVGTTVAAEVAVAGILSAFIPGAAIVAGLGGLASLGLGVASAKKFEQRTLRNFAALKAGVEAELHRLASTVEALDERIASSEQRAVDAAVAASRAMNASSSTVAAATGLAG